MSQNKRKNGKTKPKPKNIRYVVAVPLLSNYYLFEIMKKQGWSILDYVLLKELDKAELAIETLSKKANLSNQILLQILLPMCKAGWIEIITSKSGFLLKITEAGKKACVFANKSHELPQIIDTHKSKREVHADSFENYYNFHQSEIQQVTMSRFITIKEQEKHKLVELDLLVDEIYPDYEKIYKKVASNNEEIMSHTELSSATLSTKKIILVDVIYTPDGEVKIIKEDIEKLLSYKLIEQIKSTTPPNTKNTKQQAHSIERESKPFKFSTTLSKDKVDCIYGGQDTKESFLELICNAKDFLIIHSTFIGRWCITNFNETQDSEYFSAIRETLQRGVQVYILWGKTSLESYEEEYEKSHDEDKNVERLLKKFNQDCTSIHQMVNLVNFHDFRRTESHAKFIITKHQTKGACVLVSSCNFLYSNFDRFEASVLIYDSLFTKSFLEITANICLGKNGYPSTVRDEISGYAKDITDRTNHSPKRQDKMQEPNDNNSKNSNTVDVSIILKNQHYQYIDRACEEANNRIYITSDLINNTPERPIYDLMEHARVKKYLYYSNRSSYIKQPILDEVRKRLDSFTYPITLRALSKKPKPHAKVLAWDDNDVLITSLNWLSANANSNNDDIYHEIGVHIHGLDVTKNFIKHISEIK